MTDSHIDEEPAEHRRFARYLSALETVAEADEAELVTAVLQDEDAPMAQSVVVRHVDRRAAELLADSRFTAWAHTLTGVVAEYHFLTRRLQEWSLLRAITLGDPWAPEELTTTSDWCQRTVTTGQVATSPEALTLLAEQGRTRRVRNAATRRLQHPAQPS
ncbi:hypothetical protein [Streptomyces flaveus]|uniref:hypothetical protein n=1 Tax=Streptomyces flaveus TaxID=66370 RepID=UPI00331BE10A